MSGARINDGGPAFPAPYLAPIQNGIFPGAGYGFGYTVDGNGYIAATATYSPGMSLRDWLAGQVLSAAIADRPPQHFHYPENCAAFAKAAYCLADAMLAARAEAPK